MFLNKKFKVTVVNKDTVLEVKQGANLYRVLREHDLIDKMLCDGSGQCGKCKIKVTGFDVNKPTKKERLVLAEPSLDGGIRLACQYIIKSDINVDTQEPAKRENRDHGIISLTIKNNNGVTTDENEFKSVLTTDMFISKNEPEDAEPEADEAEEEAVEQMPVIPQPSVVSHETSPVYSEPDIEQPVYKEEPEIKQPSEDTAKIINHINNVKSEPESAFSNDGLLLIQLPEGIQYYHYSAGIANIASKGMIKSNERLEILLEKHLVSDFIYNNINVKDVERVIVLLDDCYFEGKELLSLVMYTSINLGNFLIEVLQPKNSIRDLIRFMRFVNQTPGKKLLIPLDSLEKAYFLDEGNLCELQAGNIESDSLLSLSEFNGKNPVIGFGDDLLEATVRDSFHAPDSISFTVFFHTAVVFMKSGLTDKRLQLKDRADVMDLMPLEITVKLGKHDGVKRFNIFRKQGTDLYIDQNALNALNKFRLFIRSVITYTEKKFEDIDNIVFYTLTDSATLADDLISLSAVPKKYEKRLRTFSGDPTIFAVQFFQEKDIETYFKKRFGNHEVVHLDSDQMFLDTQKECEIKIIS